MEASAPDRLGWERPRVERARAGDRAAFADLYEVHAGPLYGRVLLQKLGDERAAEDALSETFREALEHVYPFRADRMRATFEAASADLRFATAVMGLAQILRHSEHAAGWRMDDVRRIARAASPEGNEQRAEFVDLIGSI